MNQKQGEKAYAISYLSHSNRSMPSQLEKDLVTIDRISTLMDSAFRIPGTQIKFGWDALVGLIPGAGDTITALPLLYFLIIGWRHRLPKRLLLLMVGRQLMDLLLGSVPLLGDIFDVAYRSNAKNAKTLRDELARKSTNPSFQ